ncbi:MULTISPECIES: DUF3110 domain-containing protein [Planktothricoides]|uniref:DUF3110 domain-containing protein n=2 Tax=Planktothricoides raciborskii TaxID=132608 RepID=A0AAU8JDN7_9CYAN|nr:MULTISPECIES: DUF3110 domain-containing protein [Planktothricoides]KOR35838.1 hypothetical protein AM228_15935 [Planktothricoides sp. SR001]MBD2544243.1 DUF3110 domain-containing protein [Planktothricoides raciborskii FACHB-1370]MBD2583595.1 DUF3110 domain-containing protein [Planktothricoides raciborskii FACHB-1261]
MRIYVLLFNARTDNEGIHTLQVGDRNVVLMFESEDDATRYALMLEAQDFGAPTAEAFDSEEIEEFCLSAGYESKLISEGQLELPPQTNVDSPDWSPDRTPGSAGSAESEERTMSESELDRIRRQLEGLL